MKPKQADTVTSITEDNYTAKNIKVLTEAQIRAKFEWSDGLAIELASTYGVDLGWVKRSLEACRRAGASVDYFVSRYLDKDLTTPMDAIADLGARDISYETAHKGLIH